MLIYKGENYGEKHKNTGRIEDIRTKSNNFVH